jgi:hypothetical protein
MSPLLPPVKVVRATFDSPSLIWKAFPETPPITAEIVTTAPTADAVTSPDKSVDPLIAVTILAACVAGVEEMLNWFPAAPLVIAVKVTLQITHVSELREPVELTVIVAED